MGASAARSGGAGLLAPFLAARLICPGCNGGKWDQRAYADESASGTLACASCGRRWLVIEGVPLMTTPVPPGRSERTLSEHLVRDPVARQVAGAALGRFAAELRGVEGAISQIRQEPLERAFMVKGAPWITLRRFESEKYAHLGDLVPSGEVLLDLGCGYGASAAPFLAGGKARSVIGLDENLLLLLLFKRYTAARRLGEAAFICHHLGRRPLPLCDGAVDTVVGGSFFNHFACLKGSQELRQFFSELARVLSPSGTLLLDMVPNRQYPFPREVILEPVIAQPRLRDWAKRAIRGVPTAWLPPSLTVGALWLTYRAYMASRGRPALGFASFKRELGKAVPEAALGGLPIRPRRYSRLAADFSRIEVFDDAALLRRGELRPVGPVAVTSRYFLLRATR